MNKVAPESSNEHEQRTRFTVHRVWKNENHVVFSLERGREMIGRSSTRKLRYKYGGSCDCNCPEPGRRWKVTQPERR